MAFAVLHSPEFHLVFTFFPVFSFKYKLKPYCGNVV